ncbi:MAG TPA: sodium/solute symporter [Thermoanaerobaculia bacterium]|nr:sodium/solute symporter [Thermoanaerobaculia bacterium]
MTTADYVILIAYFAAILTVSALIARRQRSGDDFFLAGRSMHGRTLALSIMANQASAVSLVGAPAFVALQAGGGMRWLQYELALPIAMILVIVFLLPALRSVTGASIYEFAELRFGAGTRQLLSLVFLVSRGLAAGVILYASALVVSPVLGISVPAAIFVTGLFSVAYCTLGGILADIWSDIAQLAILWVGVLISAIFVLARAGSDVVRAIPLERTKTIVVDSLGLTDGNSFALVPMLLGGIILYMSYYACDQSQAQRLLAASSDEEARRALVLNGLLRFPLVLTYCLFGLLLAGLLRVDGDFAAAMAGKPADALVPTFILMWLPAGMKGLLVAAILAAAMSSLDSALNSLAAVTLEDLVRIRSSNQSAWLGRGVTLAWGLSAIASALIFARGTTGVLQLITQVGSAVYGPVLAIFLIGAATRSGNGRAAAVALMAGLVTNLILARTVPGMSPLWWNVTGFFISSATLFILAGFQRGGEVVVPKQQVAVLSAAAAVMFLVVGALPPLIAWAAGG